MARFNYRMQNILNIKYKLETQAKTAFGAAAARLAKEEEILSALNQKKDVYEAQAKELVSSRLHIREIKDSRKAIDYIKDTIRNQLVQVHIAQRNLESARVHLSAVMTERKTHEILREKAFDEFKRELEMEESKAVDELVSYSYRETVEE